MKRQILVLGVGSVLLFLILLFSPVQTKGTEVEINPHILESLEEEADLIEEEVVSLYVVDLKGEVKYPGIYEVDSTYRISDVVELAGGLTEMAATTDINFAQKVRDEMLIYIPNIHDEPDKGLEINGQVQGANHKVSINIGALEELLTLPGIGPVKAQAIINYREENGAFQDIEDLIKVSGIGNKTLESLRELIEL